MRSTLLVASAIALAAASASAQTTTTTPATGAEMTESGDAIVAAGDVYRSYEEMAESDGVTIASGEAADEIIGANVVNRDGDSLGEIEDLAVDESGRVSHALIDVSGFFEVDSRYVLVELSELRRGEGDADDDEYVLDIDEDRLERLSRYTRGEDGWRRDYVAD